jgi:hypothetical protein
MAILTNCISMNRIIKKEFFLFIIALAIFSGCAPKDPIVLRQIKDVVVDASSNPTLRAKAILYNPNKMKGRLRRIKIDIFIDGNKRAEVDQEFKMQIPAQAEFEIPIEVKLAMKEQGFLDTVFGMIGGKKMEVHYLGSIKLSYHGFPVRVPVDYKDEVRIRI